jgi:hypothetical protein
MKNLNGQVELVGHLAPKRGAQMRVDEAAYDQGARGLAVAHDLGANAA